MRTTLAPVVVLGLLAWAGAAQETKDAAETGRVTAHSGGLHGYIGFSATRPPARSEYSAGMGFYSAVWPLIDRPLADFQIGLAGCWITPDNSDNKDTALAPEGTLARTWRERGPTWESVFQTVEGGLGYWAGNHFRYGPPKFSMNATPQCYDYEVGSPGWSFFYSNEALPDNRLGIAQLSNRLLIPPDGLPFEGNPNGQFLGYTWMALPFTEPTPGDPPTGGQSWTCFLSAVNFKGPIAFYIPETWSKIGKLFKYPFLHGRGLDARPGNMGGGAMEINTVPRLDSQDARGTVYSKIPKLQFPVDGQGRTLLVQDVTYYSKAALYDAFQAWRNGGPACSGRFDETGGWKSTLTTRTTRYDQGGNKLIGVERVFDTKVFEGNVWGLEWFNSSLSPNGLFPQYYKHAGEERIAVAASDVPAETGLPAQEFKLAARGEPYTSPSTGAWARPGPKLGPFSVQLGDGSLVTYWWYRFVDQPSFQQYDWSEEKKAKLQALVEKLHANWGIDRDYMAPPGHGALVTLDPALLVTPPKGLEAGYVPIVTRQTTQAAEAPQKSLPLPGEVFLVQGRTAFVILPPAKPAAGPIPWVWYAPTLPGLPSDAEKWMFERFTRAGVAIAGIDVGESYGSPDGRALYSALYGELTRHRGFAPRAVMLGRSRGGLMTLCWAVENADKVAGFAGIYPVCNLATYPGAAKGSAAYHMTPEQFLERLAEHNPLDRLEALAKAGVPLFAIQGDSDQAVPLETNSGEMRKRYEALGGKMQLIVPPGQGHNMWPGFFQCQELVDFVLAATRRGLAGGNWPGLRGPEGNGHAAAARLPLTWGETNHVVWKTRIHDLGWSSPVVWANQVWLTTATEDGRSLFAVCLDCDTGRIVHDVKVFDNEQPQHVASVNSYASPTSAIEAERVYVHYGTYGTACLDTRSGNVLWTRRDLNCDHHEGPGSSLLLYQDRLFVNVDGRDVQYVVALDKATGKTAWKTNRSVDYSPFSINCRKAFSTPILIEAAGRLQLFSPGAKAMMAYDPQSGEELWKARYNGWSVVPRPIFGHGLLYVITDYERPELWAVRPDGRGDLTETRVAWKVTKDMPATASLLLAGGLLYMVNDQGFALCLEAETGKEVWRERLKGKHSASPLFGAGRLYFFSEKNLTTVLEPGREFKVLAENQLDDRVMATPAVVGEALLLRTKTHLYRLEERPSVAAQ